MLLANVGLEAYKHVLAAHCALSLDIVHANPRFLEKEAFRQVRFMFLLDNHARRPGRTTQRSFHHGGAQDRRLLSL